jgi:DNA processing protein
MEDEKLKYWLAFGRISGIGRARFKLLESYFGMLDQAWAANGAEFQAAGMDKRTTLSITTSRSTLNPDDEIERLNKSGVRALTWHDSDYPTRLKEIYDLPPILYVRGALWPDDERSVSVVGTRVPSAYGRGIAESFSHDLAVAGVTVVSDLARGVDGIAHRAALDAGKRTIAVMGSGLNVIYPGEHANLAERIVENGALVSEHPFGGEAGRKKLPASQPYHGWHDARHPGD